MEGERKENRRDKTRKSNIKKRETGRYRKDDRKIVL